MTTAEMTTTDMTPAEQIQATFLSAEQIWAGRTPFRSDWTWVGFMASAADVHLMDSTLGTQYKTYATEDPNYAAVRDLVRSLLPAGGQREFDTGFNAASIVVNPTTPAWTPSILTINMSINPATGQPFTLVTGACGQHP